MSFGTVNCPRSVETDSTNEWCLDPGMPVTDAGVAALNKTDQGEYIQIVGSDPKHPTYGSIVEVFHQLHCLVRSHMLLHVS